MSIEEGIVGLAYIKKLEKERDALAQRVEAAEERANNNAAFYNECKRENERLRNGIDQALTLSGMVPSVRRHLETLRQEER